MAVFASTADPRELARRVTETIRQGTVATWAIASGNILHSDPRIGGRVAFFVMSITDGAVKFALAPAKRAPSLDARTYAYHHARLTEFLLGHFSEALTRVQSTPFPGAIRTHRE